MGQADAAIAYAEAQLGKPYQFGSTGPNTFDCSGLMYAAWKAAGVSIGRTTYDQILDGVEVKRADLLPGDLVFPEIGHVGMLVDAGHVIEAPHTGAVVKIIALQDFGFWRARRVGTPANGTQSATETASITPVVNPLDPSTWPVLESVNNLAATVINPDWWKRLGLGTLGASIIIVALIFLNRGSIESVVKTGAKVAGAAAL